MDLKKWLAENIVETASAAGAGTLIAVLFVFKEWIREKITNFWLKRAHRTCPSPLSIETDCKIRELLIEARTKIEADRCRVWQFHNGSVFSSQNPFFRVSCTHESVKQGVSHEIMSSQGLLATTILELISPLFGIEMTVPYLCKLTPNQAIDTPVFWIDVLLMPNSFCKSLFLSQGVNHIIVSPLVYANPRDKSGELHRVMGFVTASFDTNDVVKPERQLLFMSKCADDISFLVNNLQK